MGIHSIKKLPLFPNILHKFDNFNWQKSLKRKK